MEKNKKKELNLMYNRHRTKFEFKKIKSLEMYHYKNF